MCMVLGVIHKVRHIIGRALEFVFWNSAHEEADVMVEIAVTLCDKVCVEDSPR